MAIVFDGPNKLISLASDSLSVIDLWSRWCDWSAVSDNSKYLPAFKQVGGDPIDLTAGTSIPIYCFMQNGWKIKPQESNHTLSVTGGVLLVEGGGDPFVNTTGSFVVRINYSQPVQAITVATGGGSPGASAADIWNHAVEGTYTAEQVLRLMASVLGGKLTGAGTGNEVFRDLSDTKDRITATVDNSGNRTAIALDVN